jgi:hypothetical protein
VGSKNIFCCVPYAGVRRQRDHASDLSSVNFRFSRRQNDDDDHNPDDGGSKHLWNVGKFSYLNKDLGRFCVHNQATAQRQEQNGIPEADAPLNPQTNKQTNKRNGVDNVALLGYDAVQTPTYSPQITIWYPQGMRVLRQSKFPRAEVMFVTIRRENIRPSKKEMNKAVTKSKLPDVCS